MNFIKNISQPGQPSTAKKQLPSPYQKGTSIQSTQIFAKVDKPDLSSDVCLPKNNDSSLQKVEDSHTNHNINRPVGRVLTQTEEQASDQRGRKPGQIPDETVANKKLVIQEHAERVAKFWPTPSAQAQHVFPEFCEMYQQIKQFNCPNFMGARIPLKTDLNIEQWRALLKDFHDTELCDFLLFGWPLGYHADCPPQPVHENHPSAKQFGSHVEKFIATEKGFNAILGPFKEQPFTPWTRVSPIMTRPKRESEQRRIIIDLSFPIGNAVNDGIDTANHFGSNIKYSLPSITTLVERIKEQGRGCYLWKADLTRAYRQWRVDPLDTPFLGMMVNGHYYLDLCPPFGCRSSAAICQRVANAMVYIMQKKNCYAIAYLDDYAGADHAKEEAERSFKVFKSTAKTLGLQLAEHKS